MNQLSPLAQASDQQARASKPDASAWVSANAGSGKTYVLVNRIIRLLLSGAKPERILCLTFTRAAAAEMEARLFKRLSGWISLPDDELREMISQITREPAGQQSLKTARKLFTRALETPGGLKIQTLHAFCESVLQRFPVEAGLAPGFTILDERASSELMSEARDHVLHLAAQDVPGSDEGVSLKFITTQVRAAGFDDVLFSLLRERSEHVANWQKEELSGALRTVLYGEFGLTPVDTPQRIVEDALEEIDRAFADAARQAFAASKSKTDQGHSANLAAGLETGDWNAYCDVFLTAKGDARSERSLATKAVKEGHPDVWEWLLAEQTRVLESEDRRKGAETAQASDALFTIASVILQRFQKMKERRGQLDYDDLVHYTRNLLTRLDSAWVLFRLDGGIDHVLIDEAQDTSPEQWEIVRQLTDEFYSGAGAVEGPRTIFAVGDHKQSIFSFQGAEPDRFLEEKDALSQRANDADAEFEDVRINISFRSTQRVLDVVDEVFKNPLAQRGMAEPEIDHVANRERQAGLVELWPLFEREDIEDRDPYDPVDAPAKSDPRIRIAQHIASTIRGWLDNEEELKPRGRAIRPGDILILVRNRTVLADAMVRSLRAANIPVAGADRLSVNSHISVMDLVALARTMHLPQDDYSLACVLKSPIVQKAGGSSLDDDDLIKLCAHREGTLWSALASSQVFAEIGEQMALLRRRARYTRPYEFFSEVLETGGARKRFAARLGAEVNDPLDEFLNLAMEFERNHPPSLHGFITWLADGDTQIKRDMDQGRDEVRVMTVHGAKGLESNVVILPDTTRLPDRGKTPPILTFPSGVPVWKLNAERQPSAVAQLSEGYLSQQMEEENRLLYVAMTRARDRLYIAGAEGRSAPRPECWYELIRSALEPVAEDVGAGVLRWEDDQQGTPADDDDAAASAIEPLTPEDWMLNPAPPEPLEPKPLAPSRLDLKVEETGVRATLTEELSVSPLAEADESRFRRGQLIHRLLQTLPGLEEAGTASMAEQFLAAHASEMEPGVRAEISAEVLQLLEAPDADLRALFAQDGLAEVPVTGKLALTHENGAPVVVSGTIDRLVVTDTQVLIADFKTNRPPASDPSEVATVYIRQLAAYAAVLQSIYPDKAVRAWLVWTYSASAMEIPSEMLEGAFT